MGVSEILASIDREITLLQQVRALLGGATATAAAPKKKVGRPKKVVAVVTPAAKPAKKAKKTKRHLSPEGRKRIAEAVKRRWEAQRKAAATGGK